MWRYSSCSLSDIILLQPEVSLVECWLLRTISRFIPYGLWNSLNVLACGISAEYIRVLEGLFLENLPIAHCSFPSFLVAAELAWSNHFILSVDAIFRLKSSFIINICRREVFVVRVRDDSILLWGIDSESLNSTGLQWSWRPLVLKFAQLLV